MINQSKFWNELHRHLLPSLQAPLDGKNRKVFRKNMINSLLGVEDNSEEYLKLTPVEDFLRDLLYNYHEIKYSRERLKVSGLLIKQYPKLPSWKTIGLTKRMHLRYHYESFINEIYLYRERMSYFLTDVKKKCKKKKLNYEKRIEAIRKSFLDSLENATRVRGRHVHLRRFQSKKIEQIESLELFEDISFLKELRDIEYRKLRNELSREIFEFHSDLEKLENRILDQLIPIIFIELKSKYE